MNPGRFKALRIEPVAARADVNEPAFLAVGDGRDLHRDAALTVLEHVLPEGPLNPWAVVADIVHNAVEPSVGGDKPRVLAGRVEQKK